MRRHRWLNSACLVALTLVASSTPSLAQALNPPKKAKTIIVRTSDAPDVAYQTIARILLKRGYGLQTSDATLRAVTTTFRSATTAGPEQVSGFVLEDSTGTVLRLTALYKWTGAAYLYKGGEEEPIPVEYGGAGASPARLSWNELYAIAVAYPGGTILYIDPKTGEATPGVPR
jgi:hypothetical protein